MYMKIGNKIILSYLIYHNLVLDLSLNLTKYRLQTHPITSTTHTYVHVNTSTSYYLLDHLDLVTCEWAGSSSLRNPGGDEIHPQGFRLPQNCWFCGPLSPRTPILFWVVSVTNSFLVMNRI